MRRWSTRHLRVTDMQAMISAHESLEAVIAGLRSTNWAGAQASVAALVPINLWIVDLYNRHEPAWLKYLQRGKSDPAQGETGEPASNDTSSRTDGSNRSEPSE